MSYKNNIKDDINKKQVLRKLKQFKYMKKWLAITFVVICLALFALLYNIYNIQKTKGTLYNKRILDQQQYNSREIPYRRGDILDRNNSLLATSEKVYNLIIDPYQINSGYDNYLESTVSLLNEVFGYDENEIKKLIADRSDSQYIVYEKKISHDKKEEFVTKQEEINSQFIKSRSPKRVHGIWFEESYNRKYPNNELACRIIGFSNSEGNVGVGGVEQYYNSILRGIKGREYGYLNDKSILERVIQPKKDGETLVLTIDIMIQQIVEKYINEWEASAPSKQTAVIIMNPNNGEILALGTSKGFDLNNPRDLSKFNTQEEIDAMSDEEKNKRLNEIWQNYAIAKTYEPGSPSKIFTVAAALDAGIISGNEVYYCDGGQNIGGWNIRCVNRNGHGQLSVQEALMVSCNDAMMQISSSLGVANFIRYMNAFGIGKKTGIDLPGEEDTSGLIKNSQTMNSVDLATNSFGQNYNTTMIHMAAAISSVVNGGYYYQPHVVKQILDSNGSVVKNIEPKKVRETVSSDVSEFINEALRKTVEQGTGSSAKVAGYQVGGKTGTAEKYPRGQGKYLVSFAGIAPTVNPKVLCYVIIDEPGVADQPHSSYAGNLFAKIMTEVLRYMNITPENDVVIEGVTNSGSEGIIEDISLSKNQDGKTEEQKKEYPQDEVIDANAGKEILPGEPAKPDDAEGQDENNKNPDKQNKDENNTDAGIVSNQANAGGNADNGDVKVGDGAKPAPNN